MTDLLLDTHACIYALAAPDRLGRGARRALTQVENGKRTAWIPAAVAAELVLLREARRVRIGIPELADTLSAGGMLRFLPLDFAQIELFAAHIAIDDPFDRLIVSACRSVGGILITKDQALADSGLVQTLWD